MVVKTIVVRNLFSFEYEGSNPSLPTNNRQKVVLTIHFVDYFFRRNKFMDFKNNKEKGN